MSTDHTTRRRKPPAGSEIPIRKRAALTPCPSAVAHHVFLVLAAFASPRLVAFPAVATIATLTGLSTRSVHRALAALRSAGRIAVVAGASASKPVTYRLSLDPTGTGTTPQPERKGKPKQPSLPGVAGVTAVSQRGAVGGSPGVTAVSQRGAVGGSPGVTAVSPEEIREEDSEEDREVAAGERGPLEKLVDAWNVMATAAGLAVVDLEMLPMTGARTRDAEMRLYEIPWPKIQEALTKVAASRYLTGREKNYRIDFGTFVRPGRIVEILEGKYDDVGGNRRGAGIKPDVGEFEDL